MRLHWTAVALLASSTSALSQATTQDAAPEFSAVRKHINEWMTRDSVPGLAIAVAKGDSILWEEGFGWADRETRVPVTPQTPFYLASVSKTITATALMILRERGKLDLDRPANDYLGSSPLWSPAWDPRAATVRRIMNHTSGLTTYDLGCAVQRPDCQPLSAGETIRRYGVLVWPPGEQFDYSNLGYYVLGEIVARVSGRDLKTFLREEVFQPIGMTHSSLGVDMNRVGETAVRYSGTRGPLPRTTPSPSGASSVYGSAHDVLLFGEIHAKVRHGVLSEASIDTMQTSVVPAQSGSNYGLSWWEEDDRFGYRTLLAQGGTDAAQAWLRIVPSDRIVVVALANKGAGFVGDVVDDVISALLPRYAEQRAAKAAQTASASTAPPAARAKLDSAYVGTWTGIVRAEDREVPVEFVLSDSGTVRGTIASRSGEVTGRARLGATQFLMGIPGDLQTSDTTSGRRLSFYLMPRNGVLNGTVTTGAPAGSGFDGRVSYWVELRKRH